MPPTPAVPNRTAGTSVGRVLGAIAVTGVLAGCGLSLPSPGAAPPSASTRVETDRETSTTTGPSRSSVSTVTPTLTPTLTPAQARAATASLGALPVKGRAPRTGYDRDAFGPAWTDDVDVGGGHNGCDTRNDVLRRDLAGERFKPGTQGCVVLSGTLTDPYTARTIAFTRGRATSSRVQIDHVVALGDAWVKGAQQLTPGQRTVLANDPLNLLAVDGPTNSAKRDADAASWLPPNKAFRCTYVARQVAVKTRYRLWVTAAEKAQISRVLADCSRPS